MTVTISREVTGRWRHVDKSNETVTSVARSEYVRIVGDDARNMTTDAAHDSANYSDSATTSNFQQPVAAHALGVG